MKKLLALLLALVMVVSLIACGEQKQPEETKAPAADNSDETKAPAQETEAPEEPVTLTMFNMYSDVAGTYAKDDVEKAIQDYVLETYNVNLQFLDAPYTVWSDAISTAINAGDDWDFGGIGGDHFNNNVHRNAFLAFDDYMDLIPAVVENVPEDSWGAYTYGGKIYGCAPVKDLAEGWNWIANQDLEDELGVKFPADEYYGVKDLVPYFYEMKTARDEKYPDLKDMPVVGGMSYINSWFVYDGVVGAWNGTVLATNVDTEHGFTSVPDTTTLFCPWMTEDFREMCKTLWQATQDKVMACYDGFDPDKYLYNNGYLIGNTNCGLIEYDPEATMPAYRNTMYMAKMAVSYTGYLQAGINVVNAACKNPEKAFELINAFYSDETLCNLTKFGIEGEHWTDADNDGVVELTEANSDPANRAWYNWYPFRNVCSTVCGKTAPSTTPAFAEKLAELNSTAVGSSNLGFVVDTAPFADELSAVQAVISEYTSQWQHIGNLKSEAEIDAMCDKFAEDLKANGIDAVLTEVQAQLDAWRAAQ